MRKLIMSSSLLIAAVLMAFSSARDGELPIGSSIPKGDVKLKDISGKEVTLQDTKKENGLLVMFTCNTCPYVIRNQSRTREVCQYAATKNIGVILLNSNEGARSSDDSFDEMKSYAKNQHYNWYYAVDRNNELADAFGANRTPECFLFDKSGKLVYHGAIDDNPGDDTHVTRKHLQQAMDEMLSGKEVSVKTSRSVGCSIKRI
jgi:thioredoxin-related protein